MNNKNYKFRTMNSISEALNTLVSAVNIAHNKGGVYSLEEAHYIHLAISYINSLQQKQSEQAPQAPQASQAPLMPQSAPTPMSNDDSHQDY